MKILALEFSSPQRSVAVVSPGCAVSEVVETNPGATRALGMIEEALRVAGLEREQIECLAVGLGPGSYTGIRAAIALAQGWQIARDTRSIGISSVECIVDQVRAEGVTGNFSVVIDAQRGEFYLATYGTNAGQVTAMSPLRIATFEEVQTRARDGDILIGPEVQRWFPDGRVIFPRAENLACLAATRDAFVSGDKLEPIYLRETTFVKAPPPRIRPASPGA